MKVVFAALFVLAFLVGSLVLLAHLRESLRPIAPPEPRPTVVRPTEVEPPMPPPRSPASEPATALEDIRVELESALLRSGVSLADLEVRFPPDGPVHFEIEGAFPPSGLLTDLERRLKRIDDDLRLERLPVQRELQVWSQGILRFQLRFQPPPAATLEPAAGRPRLAIVMDDLGRDLATGRSLLAIDLPVTFAILPGEPHATELAQLAHQHGREILIHLPMEPQGYPVTNPGGDALLVRMPAEEIRLRMAEFRRQVPHAVGGNNHMGSRFTESREGMQVVLGEMREAELFFLDSLTSARSVAYAEARREGVPAAVRDLFLDNVPEVEKIAAEIRRLARLAKRQGHAVGICHPYPQTLEALRRESAALKREGVDVVPVSRLLVH